MNRTRFDTFTRRLAHATSRRTALKTSGAGLLTASISALGLQHASAQQATPVVTGDLQLLFVQNAGATTLEPGSDDVHTLTMTEVTAQTLYFSDRPNRIAGATPTETFAGAWADMFSDSPPNATLIGHPAVGDEAEEAVVVELLDPVYDGAAGTLTYQVRILQADAIGDRTFEQEPLTALDAARNYAEAHLFIDEFSSCQECIVYWVTATMGFAGINDQARAICEKAGYCPPA